MDIIDTIQTDRPPIEESLTTRLRGILERENLDSQRSLTKMLVTELDVDFLDFSAALLFLQQQQPAGPNPAKPAPASRAIVNGPGIKMIRYRLEVGRKHQLTEELLARVLVEESGVDKKNIGNVDIQHLCTFIELPDEMPHDIFLHLKTVEINQQQLDIKRIKNRNHKKRSHDRGRRALYRRSKSANHV